MITLALDASTHVGTVAVFRGEQLAAEGTAAMRGRDSERLMPAVDAAIRDAGVAAANLQRIVCGSGPGSFTSLRIAASIAKGLAIGLDVPLYAVSSLALVIAGNVEPMLPNGGRFLAVMDALRGESYVAEFTVGEKVRQLEATTLVPNAQVAAAIAARRVVGPDQEGRWMPHARGTMRVAQLDGPVSMAAWEPFYGRLAEAQVRWEAMHGRSLPR